MTNEPVAWMSKATLKHCLEGNEICVRQGNESDSDCVIPLYTHPVDAVNISEQYVDKTQNNRHDLGISHAIGFDDGFKAGMQRAVEMNVSKTLTDEQIKEVYDSCKSNHCIDFAKAILRKIRK